METAIYHGTLPKIIEGPTVRRGGKGELDTVTWKVLCAADAVKDGLATAGLAFAGAITGYGAAMAVDGGIEEEPESELTTMVSITATGLMTAGDRRQRVISFGQREVAVGPLEKVVLSWVTDEKGEDAETSDPVEKVKRRVPKLDVDGNVEYETIVTSSGSQERWNIKEPVAQVRDTYFATTLPSTSAVGSASTPPNAPSPPAYQWSGYEGDLRGNHPNGWVLDDRQVEEIHAGILYRVTDIHAYYQALTPD